MFNRLIAATVSSDSAVLAWIGIILFIFCYVLAYDLWAHYTAHKTMTGQVRDWLLAPIMGPCIAGLWAAVFVGLTFHFIIKGR